MTTFSLSLWSTAHKDLRHHRWTIPGNAKHLMLKIHPWCGSAAQSIITQSGLTCLNNFEPRMEQQSQPKLHFWSEMLTKHPWTNCFPLLFWWWQNEDPLVSTHILTSCLTSLTTKDRTRTADCHPARLTIKAWGMSGEACKPSQGSQSLPIQTPQAFQAKFRHFSWCWMASFSRGCTTSAWACELDSDLTGFEFAIIPKCILVNITQFSIHHLLFKSH